MRTDKIKQYLIPNLPYLFIGWACLKVGTAYRLAAGAGFAQKLVGMLAAIGTADACVYTLDGRPQPLFGLYRRTCLPEAAGMLAVGENKLQLLLDRVATVYLPTADPDPFRNLNTPEELERARRSVWL